MIVHFIILWFTVALLIVLVMFFSGFNRLYVSSPNGNGLVRSNDDNISGIIIHFRWNSINCIRT